MRRLYVLCVRLSKKKPHIEQLRAASSMCASLPARVVHHIPTINIPVNDKWYRRSMVLQYERVAKLNSTFQMV